MKCIISFVCRHNKPKKSVIATRRKYRVDHNMNPDKNLVNTVEELAHTPVNSQEAQQMEQKKLDVRKEALSDDKTTYKKTEENRYK